MVKCNGRRNLLGNTCKIISCSYKGVEMVSSVWCDGNCSSYLWTMREASLKGQTKPLRVTEREGEVN